MMIVMMMMMMMIIIIIIILLSNAKVAFSCAKYVVKVSLEHKGAQSQVHLSPYVHACVTQCFTGQMSSNKETGIVRSISK